MLNKKEISMKISQMHIENDPSLEKAKKQKEVELNQLKMQLNNLIKKTEQKKNEINVLRLENNKHKINLEIISQKKKSQNEEMQKISKEANEYLQKKGEINEELINLNKQIDDEKVKHEEKMAELNKMIDNTKKIKEFHETLAFEKFSSSKKGEKTDGKQTSKIEDEQIKLDRLKDELIKSKKRTVHLNFYKLILSKKQKQLNDIIDKVKKETGIDNLDKLSSDLQLSKKTNTLFESDLKNLELQKSELENKIKLKKQEIEDAKNILNDNSSKKIEYINQLQDDLNKEEENKIMLNKRLNSLNRMIDLMSKSFKNVCTKLNFFDKNFKLESESNETVLTKCMDFLERKMMEIIQLNTDPLKETTIQSNNENITEKKQFNIIESMKANVHKSFMKNEDFSPANFNLKDIDRISKEIVEKYKENKGI